MEALSDNPIAYSRFLSWEIGDEWWPGGKDLTQLSCLYDLAAYSDSVFDVLSIPFPKLLERSVRKRRAEFLAGRYCARRVLATLGAPGVEVGSGAQREPLWPEGVKGSISHTHQIAVAVASRHADILGVGVDIEEEMDGDAITAVTNEILTEEEQRLLKNPGLALEQVVTLIFSAKESFFKAAYPLVSRYFAFDAVSMIDLDVAGGEFQFRVNYSLHPLLLRGEVFKGSFHLLEYRQLRKPALATRLVIRG